MLGIDNFEKKIRQLHSLKQLTTFAHPCCSRLPYRGVILEIILKVLLQTKQPTIYSYFQVLF